MTVANKKRMSAGEMRARIYMSLRNNPTGFPLCWLRKQAEENGHDATKLIAAMRRTGKVDIAFNDHVKMRWVYPGPALSS